MAEPAPGWEHDEADRLPNGMIGKLIFRITESNLALNPRSADGH